MACFGASSIEHFLIWLVVVCAVVAVLRLLLPMVLGWLGVASLSTCCNVLAVCGAFNRVPAFNPFRQDF